MNEGKIYDECYFCDEPISEDQSLSLICTCDKCARKIQKENPNGWIFWCLSTGFEELTGELT